MRASEDARAIHGEGRINPYAAREVALRESEVERNSDISREINAEAAMNGHVETAAEEATKNAYETRLDAMKVDEAENTKANEAMKAAQEAKAAAAQAKAAAEEANEVVDEAAKKAEEEAMEREASKQAYAEQKAIEEYNAIVSFQ